MASTKEIKRKVGSIQNTQKITRAMKMVASAKLRRANDAVLRMRPYADAALEIAGKLASTCSISDHPLLLLREEKNVEIVIITSDKGLCGASNHNVLAAAEKLMAEKKRKGIECKATIVGRVGIGYATFHRWPIEKSYPGILERKIEFDDAINLSDGIIDRYRNDKVDAVYLIFNKFISVLSQKVQEIRIAPITKLSSESNRDSTQYKYIFEPEKEELLSKLLPRVIYAEIYRAFLEASASEQAARMVAMDGATNNASELIQKLTLDFNKARQAQITRELIEISSAIEAMK